ncbi:outer membrane beta-barrel protein [Formosa haliotis]|uniref:outer membrane beta-barrel protein n=1 Tax=Formosa haliotis TaxID=1555194 RepID=UPI0008263D27|nr:outer membrane beta-barrel protein [Formosa haliotis]
MKPQLLLVLLTIITTKSFSQIVFEKGYFIDSDNQRTECLIKNMDWKNNPTDFDYKLSAESEIKKGTIQSVIEFGIHNFSKYIKRTVKMDRSSKVINNLSPNRNPVFHEETLFLKALVEGEANLYQFEDGNLVRFFYSMDNGMTVEQLIFKNYRSTGDLIKENNRYRQQLLNNLTCKNISSKDIERLKYEKDDLVKIFVTYNQCNNVEQVNFEEKQKKDLFNLTPRIGIKSSSFSIENTSLSSRNVDFGSKIGFRIGLEAEIFLPFNKNKWAIIVEPTYQSFKSEETLENSNVEVDYSSIELPIGIRHYFFLNNSSKLFVNASYILDIPMNSTVNYDTGSELEIINSSSIGLGFGYTYNDTYSVELRYNTNRDLLKDYQYYNSDYNTISVIFGYTIF